MAWTSRAGSTGINTPDHVRGYKRSRSALLARWSIEVWDDKRMIRDSASKNCPQYQHIAYWIRPNVIPQKELKYWVSIMLETMHKDQSANVSISLVPKHRELLTFREPGSSLMASFLANIRNSLTATST